MSVAQNGKQRQKRHVPFGWYGAPTSREDVSLMFRPALEAMTEQELAKIL